MNVPIPLAEVNSWINMAVSCHFRANKTHDHHFVVRCHLLGPLLPYCSYHYLDLKEKQKKKRKHQKIFQMNFLLLYFIFLLSSKVKTNNSPWREKKASNSFQLNTLLKWKKKGATLFPFVLSTWIFYGITKHIRFFLDQQSLKFVMSKKEKNLVKTSRTKILNSVETHRRQCYTSTFFFCFSNDILTLYVISTLGFVNFICIFNYEKDQQRQKGTKRFHFFLVLGK